MDSCVQGLEKHPVSTLRWSGENQDGGGRIKMEGFPIFVRVSGKLWGGAVSSLAPASGVLWSLLGWAGQTRLLTAT